MKLTEFFEDAKKVLVNADETTEQLHSAPGSPGGTDFSPGGAPPTAAGMGDRGITLASLQNNRKLILDFANAGSEKRAELAVTEEVRLYSIIFALYRPGPAFRQGHSLATGALDAKIAPGGQTWLDQIHLLYPGDGRTFPQTLQSASRQCVRLDKGTGDISGSGFLLGDGSILTACHVIQNPGYLFQNASKPGFIRYNQVNAMTTPEAGIVAVSPAVAEDSARDFALITQSANWRELLAASPLQAEFGSLPGLAIQSEALSENALRNRLVAVIGHPVSGNQGGSSADIPGVFGDAALRVKRFMPGRIDAAEPLVTQNGLTFLNHDCSTLGGASGACLVDLPTGKVLGIHVAGSAALGNRAVPMWLLPQTIQPRFQISGRAQAAPPASSTVKGD